MKPVLLPVITALALGFAASSCAADSSANTFTPDTGVSNDNQPMPGTPQPDAGRFSGVSKAPDNGNPAMTDTRSNRGVSYPQYHPDSSMDRFN